MCCVEVKGKSAVLAEEAEMLSKPASGHDIPILNSEQWLIRMSVCALIQVENHGRGQKTKSVWVMFTKTPVLSLSDLECLISK